MDIDLGNLTLVQVLLVTAVVTVIDVLAAYALAVTQGKFDLSYVAGWVQSHSVKRVFPIFALALLGSGIEPAGIPEIPALFAMALAALAAYVVETVASIRANFSDATALKDETSVPPSA